MSEVELETTVKEDTQPGAPVTPPPLTGSDEDTGQHIPPPRARSGGCGCWLPGILTALVVGVLVFVGLMLPPVNLLQKLLGVSLFESLTQVVRIRLLGETESGSAGEQPDEG